MYCLRPNVHTIHPKFYVKLVILVTHKVDSMHIGMQGLSKERVDLLKRDVFKNESKPFHADVNMKH